MNFNSKLTDKFFKTFIKDKVKPSTVKNLMTPPKKEKRKEMPHLRSFTPNMTHQVDILYLPNDKGYKYALVVVDVNTKMADAEPLKTHSSEEVVKAIDKIYNRKILKKPSMFINVDNGSEFKGSFTKWDKKNKIAIRTGMTNRHRQQALVEYINLVIGRAIFIRMNAEELQNKKETVGWTKYLSNIINIYNQHVIDTYEPLTTSKIFKNSMPSTTDKLLEIGTLVRTIKNYPDNLYKKRQDSKFRTGDIRYNVEPKPITNIIIEPNQPVMYQINNNNKVAYTIQQLQIVEPETLQMEQNYMDDVRYIVEKIINKRKKGGTYEYLLKFEGFDDTYNEWKKLKDIKDEGLIKFVEEYEKTI